MSGKKIKFVLCWHMHQPWYRESQQASYQLPWVYLHAVKDYTDMAAHLEAHPGMRAVINFTPVLLEQIEDYARGMRAWLSTGKAMSEPLLNLLAGVEQIPCDVDERARLLAACTRAHAPNMIDVHPGYRELVDHTLGDGATPRWSLLPYLGPQYFLDLLTWYHLAWLGYSLKADETVCELIAKGVHFTVDDRRGLIQVMHDAIAALIPRYRALAESGQVELAMTPYAHPIVPLLLDFNAMECAQPGVPGPQTGAYPGGLDRARWHLRRGIDVFEGHFGRRPSGVWLSEGGISDASVGLLEEFGIRWTASGEGVWANSMRRGQAKSAPSPDRRSLFCCHEVSSCATRVFFRDDGLSDLIGFEYQQWDPRAAASDFVGHVRNIAAFIGDSPGEHVVSVILDGENAWEYYPDNGHHFLEALYSELTACDVIELTTFDEVVDICTVHPIGSLCAGSWVYGSFSTWIGDRDKNRAWDYLVHAKQRFDAVIGGLPADSPRFDALQRQLAICEGSDWFWWFGDQNPAESVRDFDRLYRRQLADLYRMLGDQPPPELDQPVSSGGGAAENSGTMKRGVGHQSS